MYRVDMRTPLLADELMRPTNITLPPSEWREFRILCMRKGVSASSRIREFIREELEKAATDGT